MKKFFILSLAILGIVASESVKAQSPVTMISQYSLTLDTVTNTATKYLTLPTAVTANKLYQSLLIVFTATEISGTTAGTATIEVSANGSDWASMPPDSCAGIYASYTLTDVTSQTFAWTVTPWYGYKFRLKVTGVGTMSDQIKCSCIFKSY